MRLALITRETAAHGGDVSAGIAAACRWVAANVPVLALNLVLAPLRRCVADASGRRASGEHRAPVGVLERGGPGAPEELP
jgi:hypothetical protein